MSSHDGSACKRIRKGFQRAPDMLRLLRCGSRCLSGNTFTDALQHVRKEWIRRGTHQCIEARDQHVALTARRQRSETEAEIFRFVRSQAVETVAHRKRNRDMRQRIEAV